MSWRRCLDADRFQILRVLRLLYSNPARSDVAISKGEGNILSKPGMRRSLNVMLFIVVKACLSCCVADSFLEIELAQV